MSKVNLVELMWAVSCKKVPTFRSRCHIKRRRSVHVMTQTFFHFHFEKNIFWTLFIYFISCTNLFVYLFFFKVGVIPKERMGAASAPILVLVWQRHRSLGTFLLDASHVGYLSDKQHMELNQTDKTLCYTLRTFFIARCHTVKNMDVRERFNVRPKREIHLKGGGGG